MAGISFDGIAATYDESRGGERRGRTIAEGVLRHLVEGRIVEIGVGTGVVAKGLRALGRDAVGVDLAPAMLARARDRIGSCVAVGDAEALPLPDHAVDNALLVWVLQTVPDVARVLGEAARVVRPGGRVVVVPSHPVRSDAVWSIIVRMQPDLPIRRPGMNAAGVEDAATRCPALHHVSTELALHETFEETPSVEARRIETRQYSSLFSLDDATFERLTRPTVEALRALPAADVPRLVDSRQHIVVFERA